MCLYICRCVYDCVCTYMYVCRYIDMERKVQMGEMLAISTWVNSIWELIILFLQLLCQVGNYIM